MCKMGRSDFFVGREHNLKHSSEKRGFRKTVRAKNKVYRNLCDTRKIELPKISGIPKIINNSNLTQPKRRYFKQKEATFYFEHHMLRYQIRTYHKCKENKDVIVDSMEELNKVYSCQSLATCYKKNWQVSGFFLSRDLQPVWYECDDDGPYARDDIGKR